VLHYLANGIALPDDADVGDVVNAAGVDAYELVYWTGLDAAPGMAVAGELVGGEDDGRTGPAGPGAAADQERGQVPPWQAGRPGDGSPRRWVAWLRMAISIMALGPPGPGGCRTVTRYPRPRWRPGSQVMARRRTVSRA
jgi:hypothetical protein